METQPQSEGKTTILVIDDEQGVRDLFAKVLSRQDYNVLTAASGADGIQVAREQKVNLILLDIKMPGMDGLETLRRLKKVTPETAVIIITGFGTLQTSRKALKLGAVDYITKPFDLDFALSVIKDTLLKSSLEE